MERFKQEMEVFKEEFNTKTLEEQKITVLEVVTMFFQEKLRENKLSNSQKDFINHMEVILNGYIELGYNINKADYIKMEQEELHRLQDIIYERSLPKIEEREVKNKYNKDHHFNMKIAIKVGIDGAIMLNNIQFWIDNNCEADINYYDGEYWTFNSGAKLQEVFPYWNDKKIYRLLQTLENEGYIKSGNYNKKKYDRTKWYTLTEKYYDEIFN